MEFSGQYLTYEEYKGLGGTLDLMPFNLLEFEARKKIDTKTENRLVGGVDIPQEVKMCEYAMINSLKEYQEIAGSGGVASENIDGYSISYANGSEMIKSKNAEMDNMIKDYLLNVKYNDEHLLYIGVE